MVQWSWPGYADCEGHTTAFKAGGAGQAVQAVGMQMRAQQPSQASAVIWVEPCGSVTSCQWAIHKSSLLQQASGELKLATLRKLQAGQWTPSKPSHTSAVIQIEPDGDDPQIGYKNLPQKSWYADFIEACACLSRNF